jgi:GT2 family glycosyltransferase
VIDQASDDGSREYVRGVAAKHSNLRLVENPVNVGFPRAVNQGAAQARGELLMIVNSDVILAPGCIDRLVVALDEDPGLAVVSPMTNYVGRGPQVDPAAVDVKPEEIGAHAARVAARVGIQRVPDHLVFFCVMLRRELFDLLGGMSEVYGLGNYEDNDFCLRVRLEGLSLGIVPSAFAFHFGSRTFKEQRLAHTRWMERNEQVYYERAARLSTSWSLLTSRTLSDVEPRVSVALDAVSAPAAITPTLVSLAHQTARPYEVVVVGPTGVIEPLLSPFKDLLHLTSVDLPSGGSALAWNKALSIAQGEWLVYLRAGDLCYPTHLETLLSQAGPEVQVVGARLNEALCWSQGERDVVLARAPYFQALEDTDLLWAEPLFPAPAFAHARTCVEEIGGFDPALEPLADWDLLLRLAARYSLRWTDTVTAERRLCPGAPSEFATGLLRLAKGRERALRAVFARHPTTDARILHMRDRAGADLAQTRKDLEWLAEQGEDDLSKAKRMAAIWLGTEG